MLKVKHFAIVNHDRSIYCADGDGLMLQDGTILSLKSINNKVALVHDGNMDYHIQLTENKSNVELFKYLQERYNILKIKMKDNE